MVQIVPHQQEAVSPHPGGITGTALTWFRSCLTNRKQSVLIRGALLGQPSHGSDRTSPTGSSQSSSEEASLGQPSRGSDRTSPTGSSQSSFGGHHWDSPRMVQIVPHQQEAVSPHPGGIIGTALSWFRSCLTNRKQSVLIRGALLGQPSHGSDRTSPTGSSQSSSGEASLGQPSRGSDRTSPTGSSQSSSGGITGTALS